MEFSRGGRVQLMGIVNVTPDSFTGDGLAGDPDAAVRRGLEMFENGADLVDVGGESTRPGHTPVGAEEEIERVLPVIRRLARAGVPVSVDTSKLEVAAAAAEAGASVVNDVWGLQRAPAIAELAAERGLGLVLMHNQDGTRYRDLLGGIVASLERSVARAEAAGVPRSRSAVDPGIGFGKNARQNLEVLRELDRLQVLELPVLVGVSRKSFLGRLFGQEGEERVLGTAAAVTAAVLRGADIVRVHDVPEMKNVLHVAEALR